MVIPQEIPCPHLGLYHDPRSLTSYPSEINACHRAGKIYQPSLDHQSAACLNARHAECPIYQSGQLPVRESAPTSQSLVLPLPWLVGGSSIAILLTLILLWGWIAPPKALGAALPASSLTPIVTAQWTEPPTPAPSPTSPQQLIIPQGLPRNLFHRLGVPVGDKTKFVMYLIKGDDTLPNIAIRHKTIPAAIRKVNYKAVPPTNPGAVIIVPYAITTSENLPWLEAYQVSHEEIDMENLAMLLGVNMAHIKSINLCEDNCLLKKGDWVLVPRPRQP